MSHTFVPVRGAAARGRALALLMFVATLAAVGCTGDPGDPRDTGDTSNTSDATEQRWPDVVAATAVASGDTWTISATLSSPYDTPERYADAWRVVGPDGAVFGERLLTHDHQNEQPFTRSQSGIAIPDDVDEVTIEGRDQVNGWGGATFTLRLER